MALRDATATEIEDYQNVVSDYAARADLASNKIAVALIGVLGPLHGLSAEQLTNDVVAVLKVSSE